MARVLIVEDMALVAMELQDTVEDLGHSVIGIASTVAGALESLADGPAPEVVMLDADLRGQSSEPVARILRERKIPFVVASGFGDEVLDRMAVGEPRLSKPIDKAQLARVLVKLTSK